MSITFADMYPSKYIKGDDELFADNGTITVKIKGIKTEEFENNGKKEDKWILQFFGDTKPLILSKPNAKVIYELYGEPDNWPGKSIIVGTIYKDVFGETKKVMDVRNTIPGEGASVAHHHANGNGSNGNGANASGITGTQKKDMLAHANRIYGLADGLAKLRERYPRINQMTYSDAEDALTYLAAEPNWSGDDGLGDDEDPFADS